MQRSERELLFELLRQPTAPFREQQVRDFVAGRLQRWQVPHFEDPCGNLIVGVDSPAAYRKRVRTASDEPLRLFIAHMDHPGFHGQRWLDRRHLAIDWHGGSPLRHLAGASVWLSAGDGVIARGALRHVELQPRGYGIRRAVVELPDESLHARRLAARRLFGGFDFRAPVWRSGKRVYCRAADDLVGVFAILRTARRLFRRQPEEVPFIALLSRAEEVGFVGAIAHFELGWLERPRRPLLAVSLEASRTLPGAVIGKGPVVRLGDRRTLFAAGASHLLSSLAERLLPAAHQRRVMDGGACEATAAAVFGLPVVGLTVPLGNYHNQGFEGGMDCRRPEGPAPEFVHLDDVQGLCRLSQGLMRSGLPWQDPWRTLRGRLQANRKRYQRLLEQS
ncbi:hypothetical protein QVG61_02600 [Thiohalobacter sp. IOR34]|uniref:hypothetical protein n=1 Tax=Thiohalobacter sp. IOR34 TaxID=3057176 RepID=UPI0025B240AA|nr:hypothetical protein [Thiohalobacter sp. IOR34]WJW76000.1 hypothetical protein QVG61_02600 [Thiohalobacter sp. IOR34]